MNTLPVPAAGSPRGNAILLNRTETIGTGVHGAIGGISALVVLLLLFHLLMVAAVRRSEAGKLNGEKVFVLTRLGAYFVCLLISDLLISFGQFIQAFWASLGGITEGPLCTTQAVMIQIGGFGTAFFSATIAVHTFSVIVLQKTSPKSVAVCVIALGWTIPVVLDLIATFSHPGVVPFYGIAQHWCWIRPEYPTLRVLLHYLPMLLSALVSVVCYSLLFLVIRGNLHIHCGKVTLRRGWQGQIGSSEDYRGMLSVLANRMLWYPISYVILIMPMTVVQLLFITNHTVPFVVWITAGIILASLGFINVVIYCITRVVLARRPAPTAWDAGSQDTLVAGSPGSAVKDEVSQNLPTFNGLASNYREYSGHPPATLFQMPPPAASHHPGLTSPQQVVYAPSRHVPPHWLGGLEATVIEQRTHDHSSRHSSYSPKGSDSMTATTYAPERIVNPGLLQRTITPPSVISSELGNPRAMSPNQHQRNISRITNDERFNGEGSLAPPPRPVAAHSPSTSIGSRSERSIKGSGGESPVKDQQLSSWKGSTHGVALSAVLRPQDAPAVPLTPTRPAQRSPHGPGSPIVSDHRRTQSRPRFL